MHRLYNPFAIMLKPNLMRKTLYGLSVIVLLFTLLTACKKDESVTDGTSNPPPPAGPLNLYMTDYYPDSFYHNYATLNVTNDSANIYLKFGGINKKFSHASKSNSNEPLFLQGFFFHDR